MNYYNEIKNELINNEVYAKVKDYSKNRHDLETRYNVGKLLSEAGKHYGEGIIKEYSIKLTKELDKKYSIRLLYRMLKYYNFMSERKVPTLSAKLSWSHYDEILRFNDINKINYYINITKRLNLTVRELRDRIKSKEYERLDNNTKLKLINNEDTTLPDIIKNPIIINNPNNIKVTKEKALQLLIMENLFIFLKELGEGFTYVGNEYPIKIGNSYNYIDILLFNYIYNAFVVIELKITELRKEHIGQIETYMHYIDTNVKNIYHDKTIGIILCRKDNTFIMEYCSDPRILSREYIVN